MDVTGYDERRGTDRSYVLNETRRTGMFWTKREERECFERTTKKGTVLNEPRRRQLFWTEHEERNCFERNTKKGTVLNEPRRKELFWTNHEERNCFERNTKKTTVLNGTRSWKHENKRNRENRRKQDVFFFGGSSWSGLFFSKTFVQRLSLQLLSKPAKKRSVDNAFAHDHSSLPKPAKRFKNHSSKKKIFWQLRPPQNPAKKKDSRFSRIFHQSCFSSIQSCFSSVLCMLLLGVALLLALALVGPGVRGGVFRAFRLHWFPDLAQPAAHNPDVDAELPELHFGGKCFEFGFPPA